MLDERVASLIEAGYRLDTSYMQRGFRAPDAIPGDAWLWPIEAAHAHLVASRELAEDVLVAAAEGDGYVSPLRCPDSL